MSSALNALREQQEKQGGHTALQQGRQIMSRLNDKVSQFALTVLAGLGCLLSVLASIAFWQLFFSELVGKIVLSLAATLFEATKYFALPHVKHAFGRGELSKALISGLLFAILSAVSVFGAMTSLNNGLSLAHQQNTKTKVHTQQLTDAAKTIQHKIDSLTQHMDRDIALNYRERAKSTLLEINREEKKLESIQQELLNINQAATIEGLSQSNSNIIVCLLSFLLEITTAYLVCRCQGFSINNKAELKLVPANEVQVVPVPPSPDNNPGTKRGTNKNLNPISTISQPSPVTTRAVAHKAVPQVYLKTKSCTSKQRPVKARVPEPAVVPVPDNLLSQAKAKLINGELQPSVRAFKKTFHKGTDSMRALLRQLQNEGVIELKKGRYKIIQADRGFRKVS